MKFIKKKIVTTLAILFILLAPVISFAQGSGTGNPGTTPIKLENPIGSTNTIQALIAKVLVAAIKMGIPVVALAIIYSGFLFVKAQGNAEEITKAKDALLYSLIGAGILLGAWTIAQAVLDTVKLLAS